MIYSGNYSEEEKAHILAFKNHCKAKGLKVPQSDGEILRFMIARKYDIQTTYDAITYK